MATLFVITGNYVSFSQVASTKPTALYASNVLTLTQLLTETRKNTAPENKILFLGVTSFVLKRLTVFANNQLLLTQTVSHNTKFLSTSNNLNLVQNAVGLAVSPFQNCGNQITFTQVASNNLKFLSANNVIIFNQNLYLNYPVKAKSVGNILYFQQSLVKSKPLFIYQIFFPYQSTRLVEYENVTQILDLEQTILTGFNKPTVQSFILNHQTNFTVRRNLTVSQTFIINSNARVYKIACDFYAVPLPVLNSETLPITSVC